VEGVSGSDRIRHIANNHVFETYTGATSAGANASLSTAVGTGTLYTRMTIRQNGDIEVGGSKFIDSSRNLTNIGTISSGVITATGGNSTNWNTAYGWGNHASAGYLTSYTDTNTTYSAGTGVTLTGTTFSLTDTNAKLSLAGGTMTGSIALSQNSVGTTYGNGVSATPTDMISQVVGDNDGWRLYGESPASNDVKVIFEVVDDIETGDTWVFRNKKTYSPFTATEPFKIGGLGDVTALGTVTATGGAFSGNITQSSGSITAFGNVEAGLGHVKASTGYLIGSTTVIDSSRNATFNSVTISTGNLNIRTQDEENPTDVIYLGANNGNGAGTSNDIGTGLVFAPQYTGYTKRSAGIMQIGEGNYFRSGLAFYTNNTSNATTDWSERMRLTMEGNLNLVSGSLTMGGTTVIDSSGYFYHGTSSQTTFGKDPGNGAGSMWISMGATDKSFAISDGSPSRFVVGGTIGGVSNSGLIESRRQHKFNPSVATTSDATATIISKGTVDTTTGYQPQNWHMAFQDGGGTVRGKITSSHYSTQYSTSSDYRLKEDIQPIANATQRLLAINAVNFRWIDGQQRSDGFIAHELQEHLPEAVTGTKDATEEVTETIVAEDGTESEVTRTIPALQGVDQSKLVPLLVKTIQELEARITALENA